MYGENDKYGQIRAMHGRFDKAIYIKEVNIGVYKAKYEYIYM